MIEPVHPRTQRVRDAVEAVRETGSLTHDLMLNRAIATLQAVKQALDEGRPIDSESNLYHLINGTINEGVRVLEGNLS